MNSKVVDVELAISSTGKKETVDKMISTFYPTVIKIKIPLLNQYIQESNWKKVREVAHSYKGASSYLYAAQLKETCHQLQLLTDPVNEQIYSTFVLDTYAKVIQHTKEVHQFCAEYQNIPIDTEMEVEFEKYKTFEFAGPQPDITCEELIGKLKEKEVTRQEMMNFQRSGSNANVANISSVGTSSNVATNKQQQHDELVRKIKQKESPQQPNTQNLKPTSTFNQSQNRISQGQQVPSVQSPCSFSKQRQGSGSGSFSRGNSGEVGRLMSNPGYNAVQQSTRDVDENPKQPVQLYRMEDYDPEPVKGCYVF